MCDIGAVKEGDEEKRRELLKDEGARLLLLNPKEPSVVRARQQMIDKQIVLCDMADRLSEVIG